MDRGGVCASENATSAGGVVIVGPELVFRFGVVFVTTAASRGAMDDDDYDYDYHQRQRTLTQEALGAIVAWHSLVAVRLRERTVLDAALLPPARGTALVLRDEWKIVELTSI